MDESTTTGSGFGLEDFEPRVSLEGQEVVARFAGRESWRICWDDVVEVVIWKDEPCATGPLCFGLRTHHMKPGQYLGCSDTTIGFETVLDEIDRRFDSAFSRKWTDAVFPPMATQWMVVWGEPTGRAEQADVIWPEAA